MFSPGPPQTDLDWFLVVFYGPCLLFIGSGNFWDQTGPMPIQKRAQDSDWTGPLSTKCQNRGGNLVLAAVGLLGSMGIHKQIEVGLCVAQWELRNRSCAYHSKSVTI